MVMLYKILKEENLVEIIQQYVVDELGEYSQSKQTVPNDI